ncbi:methyltransferase domain-containing protein [Microcella alkalica]|uniref:SAM-dependent methyltransferase n=1 Tax=Microcella alkalica TaxID=355930 RepID=A0A839E8V5_9MICO|nr:methyltransferase domain-containing protein [Microcella alkalica]MBA8848991.1 SAM-dependent methyltransferase [Microcella alkalica]
MVKYTHGHHPSVLAAHAWRTIANSATYLEPHLVEGASLLDVGSGPGSITIEFARRLGAQNVVGLDGAEEAVAHAREAAEMAGLDVAFEQGDLYALPFADASADIAHAHQVLQHLGDPIAALREMARVVRPGGVVAARDIDAGGVLIHPLSPELARWLELYVSIPVANGGEARAGRRLLQWAHAAGLDDVTATASTWLFTADGDGPWWGGLWAERVVSSSFADDAVRHGLATREELEAISAAWREWAAHPDAWMLMPHGEIIARSR